MSKSRAKVMPTRKRTPVRRVAAPVILPLQVSLAPISAPPPIPAVPPKRDRTVLPSNSLMRQKVLAIISMRLAGHSKEEIATTLNIKPASVNQYMYVAGKNGWLSKRAVDPTDRLEFEIAHKVVRNLDEMLDSDNESRRDAATMKTAEGTIFKKFAEQQAQAAPMTMIGIKIEMPNVSTPQIIRENTTGVEPLWKEGEILHEP